MRANSIRLLPLGERCQSDSSVDTNVQGYKASESRGSQPFDHLLDSSHTLRCAISIIKVALTAVTVALKLRVGGPKTPCTWPYRDGIYKEEKEGRQEETEY